MIISGDVAEIKPPDYRFCPHCGAYLKTKTEEDKERKYCMVCKWTYYPSSASAVIGVSIVDEYVLMVQRNRDPFKGTWAFPAGFVEFGEHPINALTREFREETGLQVVNQRFENFFRSTDDPRNPGHLVFYYQVEARGILKNADEHENQAVDWHPINNPPKIGWEIHREIMRRLRAKSPI